MLNPILMAVLMLTSPSFEHEKSIPSQFSCQGNDINPALQITDLPDGTKSLTLIMDDPDAPVGTWIHWVMWNIPPTEKIEENSVPAGAVQGVNSWGRNDYGGPCPPSGTHRYFFKLYALDAMLDIPSTSEKADLLNAMEGHVLSEFELMGTYQKQ